MVQGMGTKATVDMVYGGPALQDHTMDVRELAPALLAIGDLLQHSNRVLNGADSQVSVRVKADFNESSFQVSLEVFQGLTEMAKALLLVGGPMTAKEILEVIGVLPRAGSLFYLIKKLAGREIEGTTNIENGCVEISVKGEGNVIVVDRHVTQLYGAPEVLAAANDMVKPLDREGIDRIIFRSAGREETIEKAERPYFAVEESFPIQVAVRTFEFTYEIISPAFEGQLKWRLSDGQQKIMASVIDESFLRDVDEHRAAFAKGDTIRAEVRVTQSTGPKGLSTEYEIVRVIEHRKARPGLTAALPFPDGDG